MSPAYLSLPPSTLPSAVPGLLLVWFEIIEPAKIDWNHIEDFLNIKTSSSSDRVLLAIDEALKAPTKRNIQKHGVTVLNAAHARSIRLLFVDAAFKDGEKTTTSEFSSRCRAFYLPGLDKRLGDIPYIVGGMLLKQLNSTTIKVERSFLIGLTNKAVSHPNLRKIEEYVETALENATAEFGKDDLVLSARHLPKEIAKLVKDDNRLAHQEF